jgi:hypothetical protein
LLVFTGVFTNHQPSFGCFCLIFAGNPGISSDLELFPFVYTNILEQKRIAGQEENVIILKIF